MGSKLRFRGNSSFRGNKGSGDSIRGSQTQSFHLYMSLPIMLVDKVGTPPSTTTEVSDSAAVAEVDIRDAPESPPAVTSSQNTIEVSEIPRLRGIHVTAGYRDAVSESKTKSLQAGFDEGFALGAELALQSGMILGSLEVLLAMGSPTCSNSTATKKLLSLATTELQTANVFASRFFDSDGLWSYTPKPESGDLTFTHAAESHPVTSKWAHVAEALTRTNRSHTQPSAPVPSE
jgi:Essential protein Yae1, N terminal